MPLEINISKRERIFINPQNGQIIPKIERGVVAATDLGKGGEDDKADAGGGEAEENQEK